MATYVVKAVCDAPKAAKVLERHWVLTVEADNVPEAKAAVVKWLQCPEECVKSVALASKVGAVTIISLEQVKGA